MLRFTSSWRSGLVFGLLALAGCRTAPVTFPVLGPVFRPPIHQAAVETSPRRLPIALREAAQGALVAPPSRLAKARELVPAGGQKLSVKKAPKVSKAPRQRGRQAAGLRLVRTAASPPDGVFLVDVLFDVFPIVLPLALLLLLIAIIGSFAVLKLIALIILGLSLLAFIGIIVSLYNIR